MHTAINIRLDRKLNEKAEQYALAKHLSLSALVETYLTYITSAKESLFGIAPFVKSISSGVSIPVNTDYKKEHTNYLTEKYQ